MATPYKLKSAGSKITEMYNAGLSVRDIAAELGVTESAIYYFIANKCKKRRSQLECMAARR